MSKKEIALLSAATIIGLISSILLEYYLLNNYMASLKLNNIIYYSFKENIYSVLRGLALFSAMVVGIFSKASWDEISNYPPKTKLKIKIVFKRIVSSKKLWLPIIISPLIYYPIYILSQTQPNNLVAFFLAFQNGFFWKSIFKDKQNG